MQSTFTLDKRAATGFSNAAAYDQNRPSYPQEAVDKLLNHLGVAGVQNAKIIDLACGTGKFTELLAARPEDFEIIGVEPYAGMREILVKKGLGNRVKVEDGDAGNMPVEEDWGDACIAAQAFHWFATESSLREIHRVLRPGAAFGVIWNIDDYNAPKDHTATTPWEQKLKDLIDTTDDGHYRFRDMKWKEVFDQQQDTTPLQTLKDTFTDNLPSFSLPLGEESIKWTHWLSDEKIWDRFSTLSQIANLTEERREGFHQEVLAALKEHGERNQKGEVAMHGITYLAWTSRV
ncbi:methyltransferase [Cadophora sp. MPI-SDFR-AT-0126]|nr:methyltransferase [Leotiomycetes sp. MPI-SDFR-AT-0126]